MGKFRPRVKGKGKRWLKGHCSSSNPQANKFRNAAKNSFFQDNTGGQSKLTTDALQKHDVFMGTKSDVSGTEETEDYESATTYDGKSVKTFQTFASDWSACSNVSFSKFLNKFSSTSALHKEMLAILAAVADVIKSNGGSESTTEYFAALMTTLSTSESEESLGAVLSLLGMGIKSVPQSVLRKKFSEASHVFMDILGRFAESENQVIIRSVIGCLCVLLRNQENVVWKNASTTQVLDSILAFSFHSKPKIRKAAQHAVCSILKSPSDFDVHPAASHVAKFCIRLLENSAVSVSTQTTLLHILGFVKETISTYPKQNLKVVCETILKVMTLNNVLVSSCGMQALHSLFVSRPSPLILPAALNAQLISALFDYQPPMSDAQPTMAWLAVMQEAYVNLGRQNMDLCCAHLPKLFSTVSQLWLIDRNDVLSNSAHALASVMNECLKPACCPEVFHQHSSTVAKVFSILQEGLKYHYHSAWKHIIHLLAVFFECCGAACERLVLPCLTTLGELRNSHQFACINEVDYAIGRAVRSLGPTSVIKAVPLQVVGEDVSELIKRSWLLPVLRESIASSQLKVFLEYFLPLASVCWKKSKELVAQQRKAESVTYELFQSQIWSLLPSFCNNPTDIKDSFKNIAKVLGSVISDRKDVRLPVMGAIRKLILCNQEGDRSPEKEQNLQEIARFSKNYLPILFNLYTTKGSGGEEEGHRLAAFETIKVYLSITPQTLQQDLCDRAHTKLKGDGDSFVKESVLDLLRLLLPYQNEERISVLYETVKNGVSDSSNARFQKKSYRLLEVLCSSDKENCQNFLRVHLSDIQHLLLSSLSKSATSSRGARLRCLIHLVRKLSSKKAKVIKEIVPEAILCCKDINERCRQAAHSLLYELGLAMLRWEKETKGCNADCIDVELDTDDEQKVMRDYIGLLLAGLAGSSQLASATLLALADITHHFKAKFPEDLLLLLLENVCLLITSATREVTGSALSYLKIFVYTLPPEIIGPHLPTIIKALIAMTDDCRKHFRRVTQHMLDRMIRKFGCETIEKLVPANEIIWQKRIKNLRKLHARKQRQREERLSNKQSEPDSDDDDFTVKARAKSIEEILAESDDELDMESETAKPQKSSKIKEKSWLKEGAGDIVDLTDSMAASKISASKPKSFKEQLIQESKKKKHKDGGFKTAPDGRLIIADNSSNDDDSEEEDSVGKKSKSRRKKSNIAESDSDEDLENSNKSVKGRKRRLSTSTEGRSTVGEPQTKYQAGGSGIHRAVGKAFSVKSGGTSKSIKSVTSAKSNVSATAYGSEFRAKKAKGDVKKKGGPDPYTYVPLNRGLLNKRKRLKQAGQFKTLVKAARKGAATGRVSKIRSSRK